MLDEPHQLIDYIKIKLYLKSESRDGKAISIQIQIYVGIQQGVSALNMCGG